MIPSKKIVQYGAIVLTDDNGKINDHECINKETKGLITRDDFAKKSDAIDWARDQVEELDNSILIYGLTERGDMICPEPHGQWLSGEDFLSPA